MSRRTLLNLALAATATAGLALAPGAPTASAQESQPQQQQEQPAAALAAAAARLAESRPSASSPEQPPNGVLVRRMLWDRTRRAASLARQESRALRDLQQAEQERAARPDDPALAGRVEEVRRALEELRRTTEQGRQAFEGQGPLEKAAYLGVASSPASAVLRRQLRLPEGVGLVVDYVEPGSPAAAAGLEVYDVAVRLNEQVLVNPPQLAVLVRTFDPGTGVTLTVVREGRERPIAVKLVEREVKPIAAVLFGDGPPPGALPAGDGAATTLSGRANAHLTVVERAAPTAKATKERD